MLKVYPFSRLPEPALVAVKWLSITIAAVAVLLLSTRKAPAPPPPARAELVRSIPLTLTGEAGQLSLAWDREAPAIQAGQCGILWIADGAIHRRLILDASQLRAGKLIYWPVNKDVSFEIQMSAGNNRSGEAACGNDAIARLEPAERPAGRNRRVDRTTSRSRLNRVHTARRQSIESGQSEHTSGHGNDQIESVSESSKAPAYTPAFTIEGESQLVATLPVHAVPLQVASEIPVLSTAIKPAPQRAPEPFASVTVEAAPESRLGRMAGKIPLLRRLRRPPEFLPPRPVRQTTPAVPAELSRTLNGEMPQGEVQPLDVRAFINESGKVTYAEMVSKVTEANRRLASLAVFDARHWEFTPAQLGAQIVPGEVILRYRFGNPLLASARDQR